jgi:hypothetical protein
MFDVSRRDGRLPNKAEVLVLRDGGTGEALPPFAIAAGFLAQRPVYHVVIDGAELVVLTDASGANRVYRSDGIRFESLADSDRVIAADGRRWRVREDGLVPDFDGAAVLPRVAAHRAFWFGWYAQYPETVLID